MSTERTSRSRAADGAVRVLVMLPGARDMVLGHRTGPDGRGVLQRQHRPSLVAGTGHASPGTGTVTTKPFTFSVVYSDTRARRPSSVTVAVVGLGTPITLTGPNAADCDPIYQSGATYTGSYPGTLALRVASV